MRVVNHLDSHYLHILLLAVTFTHLLGYLVHAFLKFNICITRYLRMVGVSNCIFQTWQ